MVERRIQLGAALKKARIACDVTQEELAARADVTSRYIMAIENEGRESSYGVIYKIIHGLHISADLIFYPDQPQEHSERTQLIHLLESCSDRDIRVLLHVIQAILNEK